MKKTIVLAGKIAIRDWELGLHPDNTAQVVQLTTRYRYPDILEERTGRRCVWGWHICEVSLSRVKWLNHLSRTMFLTCPWNSLALGWPLSPLLQLSLPAPLSVISFLFHNWSLDLCNFVYSATSILFLACMPLLPILAFPVKAVQSLNPLHVWGQCPGYPLPSSSV